MAAPTCTQMAKLSNTKNKKRLKDLADRLGATLGLLDRRQIEIHVGLRLESWDFSGRRSGKREIFFLQSPARGKMGYEAGFGGKRLFVRLFHLFMDGRLCPEMPSQLYAIDIKIIFQKLLF